jgi:hypothetical protein
MLANTSKKAARERAKKERAEVGVAGGGGGPLVRGRPSAPLSPPPPRWPPWIATGSAYHACLPPLP